MKEHAKYHVQGADRDAIGLVHDDYYRTIDTFSRLDEARFRAMYELSVRRRYDYVRIMKRVEAITEVSITDGREVAP